MADVYNVNQAEINIAGGARIEGLEQLSQSSKDISNILQQTSTSIGNTNKSINSFGDLLSAAASQYAQKVQMGSDGVSSFMQEVLFLKSALNDGYKWFSQKLNDISKPIIDLNNSGIALNESLVALNYQAIMAGMSVGEFTRAMTKHSQAIRTLGAYTGEGVSNFAKQLNTFHKNNADLLLTKEQEMEIVGSYFETFGKYSVIQGKSQAELNREIDVYGKHLKELSLATGKSVESIIQETDARNKAVKLQVALSDPRNKRAYETMVGMGFSPDLIDAIMFGKQNKDSIMFSQLFGGQDALRTLRQEYKQGTLDAARGKEITESWRAKGYTSSAASFLKEWSSSDTMGFLTEGSPLLSLFTGAQVLAGSKLNQEEESGFNGLLKNLKRLNDTFGEGVKTLGSIASTLFELLVAYKMFSGETGNIRSFLPYKLKKGLAVARKDGIGSAVKYMGKSGLGGLKTIGTGALGLPAGAGGYMVGNLIGEHTKADEVSGYMARGGTAALNVASHLMTKEGTKLGSKVLGKAAGKFIPGLGLGLSMKYASDRLAKGEYGMAIGEAVSGIASTFPGIGTGISLATDALMGWIDYNKEKDKKLEMDKKSQEEKQKEDETIRYLKAMVDEMKRNNEISKKTEEQQGKTADATENQYRNNLFTNGALAPGQ